MINELCRPKSEVVSVFLFVLFILFIISFAFLLMTNLTYCLSCCFFFFFLVLLLLFLALARQQQRLCHVCDVVGCRYVLCHVNCVPRGVYVPFVFEVLCSNVKVLEYVLCSHKVQQVVYYKITYIFNYELFVLNISGIHFHSIP